MRKPLRSALRWDSVPGCASGEEPFVIPGAAILEPSRSRQTTRRLDEGTTHQLHRVYRQVQQESTGSDRGPQKWCPPAEETHEVPDTRAPNHSRLHRSTVVFLLG